MSAGPLGVHTVLETPLDVNKGACAHRAFIYVDSDPRTGERLRIFVIVRIFVIAENTPEAINSSFSVRTNFNVEPVLISDFKTE